MADKDFEGPDDGDEVVDLLFDGRVFHELRTPRVHTRHSHGTGCTFSAAVAAYLARGLALPDAAARAQAYVAGALRHALGLGHGRAGAAAGGGLPAHPPPRALHRPACAVQRPLVGRAAPPGLIFREPR